MRNCVILCFLIVLCFCSCNKDKNIDVLVSNGVFIINEGNFSFGNAEVSVYNPSAKTVSNNLFHGVNGYSLGDVAQSMYIKDSLGFIVVNNSAKIEVVKIPSLQKVRTISLPGSSPRYLVPVNDSIAYVSELYSNKIHVVNYAIGKLVTEISMPQYTEHLVKLDEYVFAEGKRIYSNANSKGALIRLRATDNTYVDKVEFNGDLNGLVKDKDGNLWIAVDADTAHGENASIKRFDKNLQLSYSYNFSSSNWHPSHLSINGSGNSLFFLADGVYKCTQIESGINPVIVGNTAGNHFYSLGIEPKSEDVYVVDALDYVQSSRVFRYNVNGKLLHSFTAGIISGNFAFSYE